MSKEEKHLLLKDLCARLPYETMFYSNSNGDECLLSIDLEYCKINELYTVEQIKPYLRPMSSMTEEEQKEYENCYQSDDTTTATLLVDFYNKKHFDYRGLIEKNLALEAKEGVYNLKEK